MNGELTVKLNNVEYNLATNLRVAYMVQAQNDHAPYAEVFSNMFDTDTPLEKQINVLYAAFIAANPSKKETYSSQAFLDAFLDTYNYTEMMQMLQKVAQGVLGLPDDVIAENSAPIEDAVEAEKN